MIEIKILPNPSLHTFSKCQITHLSLCVSRLALKASHHAQAAQCFENETLNFENSSMVFSDFVQHFYMLQMSNLTPDAVWIKTAHI